MRGFKVAVILCLAMVAGCSVSAGISRGQETFSVLVDKDTSPSQDITAQDITAQDITAQDLTAQDAPDNMRTVFDNLGRVRAYDQSGNLAWLGSGNIIKRDGGYLNVLTNSHVAGSRDHTYTVEFFRYGMSLGEFDASTIGDVMSDSLDIAVLEIKEVAELRDLPAFYPVVRDLQIGTEIFKVGAARGEWPIGRIGHIVDVTPNYYIALPKAIGGVSGSSIFIFDSNGNPEMVGLTAWSINYNGETHAMSMRNVHVVKWLDDLYSRPLEDIVEPEVDSGGLFQKLLDRIRDLGNRNDREFKRLGDRLRDMESDHTNFENTVSQLRDDNEELLDLIEEHDKDIREAKIFNGTIMEWLQKIFNGVEDNADSNGSITEKLNDSFASVKIIVASIKIMFWGMVALLVASLFFKSGFATTALVAIVTFFFRTIKLAYVLIHNAVTKKNENPETLEEALSNLQSGIAVGLGTNSEENVKKENAS